MKSVRIRSYSDPYSDRMQEDMEHNNSFYDDDFPLIGKKPEMKFSHEEEIILSKKMEKILKKRVMKESKHKTGWEVHRLYF